MDVCIGQKEVIKAKSADDGVEQQAEGNVQTRHSDGR